MNISIELLKEHSKKQALKIASFIGDDPERFKEFLDLFLNGSYRITQRAAMVLGVCASSNPNLLNPHLKIVIENLQKPVHDSVIRNTLKVLQLIEIPKEFMGVITEICFDLLTGKQPVAIKVFAMTVLYNISVHEPDLKNELKIVIEDQMPYGSSGFISRGSKILKKLKSDNSFYKKSLNGN